MADKMAAGKSRGGAIAQRWLAFLFLFALIAFTAPAQPALGQTAAPVSDASSQAVPIESVSQSALAPRLNQLVTVVGTIGNYLGNRSRYRFTMDDGSAVVVLGQYPRMGGTHWTITGRVVWSGDAYALAEVTKAQPAVAGNGVRVDQSVLLAAGFAALGVAFITVIVVRARIAQQKLLWEARVALEKERAAAALALAAQGSIISHDKNNSRRDLSHTIILTGSLHVISGPHRGEKYPIQTGGNRIGRLAEKGCEILLEKDGEVSGYHGSIQVSPDGRAYYVDSSRAGATIDGDFVHRSEHPLHDGSEIEIGASKLRLELRGARNVAERQASVQRANDRVEALLSSRGSSLSASGIHDAVYMVDAPTIVSTSGILDAATAVVQHDWSDAPATPPDAYLRVLGGDDDGQIYQLHDPVTTLGRERRDIVIAGDQVSRRHASITVVRGRYVLTDDNSTHGTFVNGVRVGHGGHPLVQGDCVTLGSETAKLRYCEE